MRHPAGATHQIGQQLTTGKPFMACFFYCYLNVAKCGGLDFSLFLFGVMQQISYQWRLSMKFVAVVLISIILAGCADTGPLKIAKDTYSISVRVPFSGPSGAKGDALNEANRFCTSQDKQLLLQSENSYECALHGGCGEAEITFLCVDEKDSRYSTPQQMRKDNGIITIQNR
ncbi:hypothetical protein [Chromobacterium subtsugae]|uniref:hypothetical protein n=1 Tax=Chromobacterium subtsugae TaxID=251747 RepID=UPI00191C213C|nr:hypothetical protein [Chromobacterium subtsugae]